MDNDYKMTHLILATPDVPYHKLNIKLNFVILTLPQSKMAECSNSDTSTKFTTVKNTLQVGLLAQQHVAEISVCHFLGLPSAAITGVHVTGLCGSCMTC